MKLPTINDSGRGQVGIGTLIIFIALVLVAAVAAGVLVNTSGELQSRASDTGSDAQAQVSNQIDVVSATGEDGDASANGATEFTATAEREVTGNDVLDDNSERYVITIDADALESGGLAEGEDAELQIVEQSGASTVYGVNVPDVLTGTYVEV
jgi:flagellin-like protein